MPKSVNPQSNNACAHSGSQTHNPHAFFTSTTYILGPHPHYGQHQTSYEYENYPSKANPGPHSNTQSFCTIV